MPSLLGEPTMYQPLQIHRMSAELLVQLKAEAGEVSRWMKRLRKGARVGRVGELRVWKLRWEVWALVGL